MSRGGVEFQLGSEDDDGSYGARRRGRGGLLAIELIKVLSAGLMVVKHGVAYELLSEDFEFRHLYLVMSGYSLLFTLAEVVAYRKNIQYLTCLMLLEVAHMTLLAALCEDNYKPYVALPLLFFLQVGLYFVWSALHRQTRSALKAPKRSHVWFWLQFALLLWIPGVSTFTPFFQRNSRFREASFERLLLVVSGVSPFFISETPVLFAALFSWIHTERKAQERSMTLGPRRSSAVFVEDEDEEKDEEKEEKDDVVEEVQPQAISKLFGVVVALFLFVFSVAVVWVLLDEQAQNRDMERNFDIAASVVMLIVEVSMAVLIIFVVVYARLIFIYGGDQIELEFEDDDEEEDGLSTSDEDDRER